MFLKAPCCRGFFIALCFVLTFLFVGFIDGPDGYLSANPTNVDLHAPASYRQLRYTGVFGQRNWSTCGPAAVATLLHFFYGVDVDEAAVLGRAIDAMEATGQDTTAGISALALVHAFQSYGFPTSGYRLTPDALAEYFRQGGLPVVLHVTIPEQHYVVAVGLVGNAIVVADPSWGRRIEPYHKFMTDKGFSGVTLVPLPGDEDGLEAGQRHQRQALEQAARRLLRLADPGRRGVQ